MRSPLVRHLIIAPFAEKLSQINQILSGRKQTCLVQHSGAMSRAWTYGARETGVMLELEKHNLTRGTDAPAAFLIQKFPPSFPG